MSDIEQQSRLELLLKEASDRIITIDDIKADEYGFVANYPFVASLTKKLGEKINDACMSGQVPNPYLYLNVAYCANCVKHPEIAWGGIVNSLVFFSDELFTEGKARAVHLMGNIFLNLLEFSVAEAYFRKALELDETHFSYINLGRALIEQGSLEQAHSILKEAREKYPDTKYLEAMYAYCQARRGDFDESFRIAQSLPDTSDLKHRVFTLKYLKDAKTKFRDSAALRSELHKYMSLMSNYFMTISPEMRTEYSGILRQNGKYISAVLHSFMAGKRKKNAQKFAKQHMDKTMKMNFGIMITIPPEKEVGLTVEEAIFGEYGIKPERSKLIEWAYRLLEDYASYVDKDNLYSRMQAVGRSGAMVVRTKKLRA